ncbi:phosphatase PAP2 family protein [Roseateles amylovorans]|uniref:Phosphatase PAP2 family protein n=1 Tax=Roseateles amylovorans TaxID=2978473 RepID=A0ABY6B3M1_9BURK|nr:phosphatase PAP2 family protein [Roseateles amylovorans]UXH79829.1 phosphatase PAP2 family protein [Roseateles amylovorans]
MTFVLPLSTMAPLAASTTAATASAHSPTVLATAPATAAPTEALAPWLHLASQAGAQAPWLFLALLTTVGLISWLGGRVLLRQPHPTPTVGSAPPTLMLVLRLGAGFGLIVGCAALFAEIAEALQAGAVLGRLDEAFILGMIDQVPAALLQAFYGLTFLSNRASQYALGISVALLLLWGRRPWLALGWALAVAGNGLLNTTLKHVFERARPEHPTPWLTETGFSFPSGHSSGAVVTFGMLAYLATRLLPARWHLPALVAAAMVAFSVGASRIFLRVHFPSDVLAGFSSGLAWLTVCIVSIELVRWYRRLRA